MYARYLMERKELDEARKLMQRAIQCAEKKKRWDTTFLLKTFEYSNYDLRYPSPDAVCTT
jgi:hypothetical protein